MNVFIIASVRNASCELIARIEQYVADLEEAGVSVHMPHRDTDQTARGIDICLQNMEAIKHADEVHVFYSSRSQGTHFDLGAAFALQKTVVIVENEPYGEGKSFPRMLEEWSARSF